MLLRQGLKMGSGKCNVWIWNRVRIRRAGRYTPFENYTPKESIRVLPRIAGLCSKGRRRSWDHEKSPHYITSSEGRPLKTTFVLSIHECFPQYLYVCVGAFNPPVYRKVLDESFVVSTGTSCTSLAARQIALATGVSLRLLDTTLMEMMWAGKIQIWNKDIITIDSN